MLSFESNPWLGLTYSVPRGTTLTRRAVPMESVFHVNAGRVALRVNESDGTTRHVGMVEGPCWLNATCAVLGEMPLLDAVADTALRVQHVALHTFAAEMAALPPTARSVLTGVALAHRQQTEQALSRLAKDADARCAEWLLRHAEPAPDHSGALTVFLRERKCMVAAQLGIAPETFSRVLRALRERSLISGSGRVLNLVDLRGLRALAGA